jgi:hypothetical protein
VEEMVGKEEERRMSNSIEKQEGMVNVIHKANNFFFKVFLLCTKDNKKNIYKKIIHK